MKHAEREREREVLKILFESLVSHSTHTKANELNEIVLRREPPVFLGGSEGHELVELKIGDNTN